jgi:hypothetical protein
MQDCSIHSSSRNKALSDYWRRSRSSCEAIELANVMQSLRRVAGHLGPYAGTVEYAGMCRSDQESILVDPASIMGRYPVPAEKVDIIVGTVVHEALHRKEWSGRVWKLLEQDFSSLDPKALIMFQKIVHTGEDIYVDSVLEDTILCEYLAGAREKALAEAASGLAGKDPSIDCLAVLWWASAWGMDNPSLSSRPYEACLNILSLLGEMLRNVRGQAGVTTRCVLRAGLYRDAWHDLSSVAGDLAVHDRRLFWCGSPAAASGRAEDTVCPRRDAAQAFTPDLAHEIEHRLAACSTDITPLIEAVVGPGCDEVVPTSRWDFPVPVRPVIDHGLVARLCGLLSYRCTRRVEPRAPGELVGRRLHRPP